VISPESIGRVPGGGSIYRLEQHRPMQFIKLTVEDGIESRVIQLQERSVTVDTTPSTDDSGMED
jgi:hypothetical protein